MQVAHSLGQYLSVLHNIFAPRNLKLEVIIMTKEEMKLKREEILAELLSTPYLKDIPYKLIESEEVPNTPLMRNFLYTFEFCRRRYI